jgi:hypothetical protein
MPHLVRLEGIATAIGPVKALVSSRDSEAAVVGEVPAVPAFSFNGRKRLAGNVLLLRYSWLALPDLRRPIVVRIRARVQTVVGAGELDAWVLPQREVPFDENRRVLLTVNELRGLAVPQQVSVHAQALWPSARVRRGRCSKTHQIVVVKGADHPATAVLTTTEWRSGGSNQKRSECCRGNQDVGDHVEERVVGVSTRQARMSLSRPQCRPF